MAFTLEKMIQDEFNDLNVKVVLQNFQAQPTLFFIVQEKDDILR